MSRTNPENVGDDLLVEVERDVVGRAGARQVGGEKAGAHPGGLRLGLLPHRLQQTLWVEEEASRVVVSSLCRLCSSLGVHPPPPGLHVIPGAPIIPSAPLGQRNLFFGSFGCFSVSGCQWGGSDLPHHAFPCSLECGLSA